MSSVVIKLKNRSKHAVHVGAKPMKKDDDRLYLIGSSSKASVSCKTAGLERKHALVRVHKNDVFLYDLAKKGDVTINGDHVGAVTRLLPGDQLQIAELRLDLSIHRRGEPEVKSGIPADSTDDISQWLMEEDERERQQRLSQPATRKVDTASLGGIILPDEETQAEQAEKEREARRAQRAAGKTAETNDSVEAADSVLSKKFNSINLRR